MMGQHLTHSQTSNHSQTPEQGSTLNYVQEQSLADILAFRESQEQRGEQTMELLPVAQEEEEEELEDIEEFEAEMSLDDEDALSMDESTLEQEDFEEGPFSVAPKFEIRVVVGRSRKARCIVPELDWPALDGRLQTIASIAKWLEEEEGELLGKGVETFLEGHTQRDQKDFAVESGIDRGTFSRHIRNVYLSWSDASIPLWRLFL